MPTWTDQQRDAIADRGHSLIVCAAAGSGKTAVLVERIVQLVREGCPVERLLVVTFTNAAAGEMRLRIGEALSQAAREEPALGAQVMALPHASISTLHRFCAGLLREHFQALGIDPAFRIGDEQECGVLSSQAMEDALYACYDVSSDDFLAADACYKQEDLVELAQDLYSFMMTRPDPWNWLDAAIASCSPDADALADSEAVRLLLGDAAQTLEQLTADARQTLSLCGAPGGPAHYADAAAQDLAMLSDLSRAAALGYEPLREVLSGVAYAKLGRKAKGDIVDEAIAEQVKARRAQLKKALSALAGAFEASLAEEADDLRLTQAPLRGLAELLRTYHALYTAAKRQRGIMDFNDLEHGALDALALPEVREAMRERYRYVFVDEYQDSSAIQEAILGSFAREDGVFLVGDVKQSIYRFRQAEPSLFLQKAERFDREDEPLCRRIDLQRNFRSRAGVLEGVNAVFSQIMRADATEIDYGERERLIPGFSLPGEDPPVELHILYRPEDGEPAEAGAEIPDDAADPDAPAADAYDEARELAAIEREALIAARRIRELVGTPYYDAKAETWRPLRYRDIALLLRSARTVAPLAADVLKSEGIPVFCDAGEGYFDIPEIRAMMALLTAIESGVRDEALLAALCGPACGLSDAELAQIRIFTPDARTPYHEAVRRYREEQDDALAGKLRAFDARLSHWRLIARHQGVDRLIEHIYAETGFLAQAGALPGGAARQANLHLLTTRARDFMRAQGGSLRAFLRYAERLRAGGDRLSASAIGENEDVVRIMTAHKSKGLEFPVVFMLGLGRRLGIVPLRERALLHAQLGAGLPCVDVALGSERDTLLRRAIRIAESREQLAEEVRILYVAMTRPRDRLILIGDCGKKAPPELWLRAPSASILRAMRTGLDMLCPTLFAAGADLTRNQQDVTADGSHWQVFAHRDGASAALARRTDEGVQRLIARLAATKLSDHSLAELLSFSPAAGRAGARKTSVSAVLRDEKSAAEDEIHLRPAEPERLPRFMLEQRVTGAQIGTAFHRMMRMLDLDPLRNCPDLRGEITRQAQAMREDGVVTAAEAAAVPAHMLCRLFEGPLGARLLASPRVMREWAFTWKRQTPQGETQLLQGVIDCCFEENGAWILLDYKTDPAADVPAVMERHRPQLSLYADALTALTQLPVRERVLYLVRAGKGYNV